MDLGDQNFSIEFNYPQNSDDKCGDSNCGIVFEDGEEIFDPSDFHENFMVTAGRDMNQNSEKDIFTTFDASGKEPLILQYYDVSTGTTNETVTVGGTGKLHGSRLTFNPEINDEGVFFIYNNTELKVDKIKTNHPGELVFEVPEMETGTYYIELRTRLNDKTSNIHVSRFIKSLDVIWP